MGIFTEEQTFYTSSTEIQTQTEVKRLDSLGLIQIEFFLNRDIRQHKRVIYGPLEFLGDVGGLSDALTAIGSALISIFQYFTGNRLSAYLLTHIFDKDNSHKNIELS